MIKVYFPLSISSLRILHCSSSHQFILHPRTSPAFSNKRHPHFPFHALWSHRQDLNSNLACLCIIRTHRSSPTISALRHSSALLFVQYQNEPADRRPCANTTPMPRGTCPNNVLINQTCRPPPACRHRGRPHGGNRSRLVHVHAGGGCTGRRVHFRGAAIEVVSNL